MSDEIFYLKNLMSEQRAFVENFSHNCLVSASAGTGKTTTMISKLTYLIVEKDFNVEDFLVVTYTNAAANEMRHKLYIKLLEVLNSTEDDVKCKHIYQELEKINTADIGTLHAICKKWVKKYFYILGIDPSFNLVVDKEQEYLLDNSINFVLENINKVQSPNLYELYESFNGDRKDQTLKDIIKTIYGFLCSKYDGDTWKKDIVLKLKNTQNNEFLNYLINNIKTRISELIGSGENLLITQANLIDKFGDFINNRLAFLKQLNLQSNFFNLVKECQNSYFISKPPVKGTASIEEKDFDAELKAWHEEVKILKKEIDEKYSFTEKEFEAHSLQLFDYTTLLFDLTDMVKVKYNELKSTKHYLDFSDLEQCTIQLLKNVQIKQEISNKYKMIFVDEYQDINEVQEFIISSISKCNNLNLIGDVKQSIYAFRLSKPQNFIDKIDLYNKRTSDDKLYYFNYNFRSENNILQFVNSIFDVIITKSTIGIDYKNTSRLKAGKPSPIKQSVKLDLIDTLNEDECASDSTNAKKTEWLEAEAKLVANEIIDLIENKFYYKNDEKNKYKYKDIAILTRNRGEQVFTLYKALTELNIPVSSTFRSEIFKTFEVQLLINYLKIINNGRNDIELVGVLSFLYNLSPNELAEIKLASNDKKFYDCLCKYSINGANNIILNKLKSFNEDICSFKGMLSFKNIYELINEILIKFDLINLFKTYPDGLEKESNIYEFLGVTMNENLNFDLPKFLDYIKNIENNQYVITTKNTDNCVKIMTMHSSKGLGFPAVIVTGLNTQFNINKGTSDIVLNDKYGVALQYKNNQFRDVVPSLQYQVCKLVNAVDQKNEEIRLLYVALTRAEHNLIMVGSCKFSNLEKIHKKSVFDCKSMLELILFSLDKFDLKRIVNEKEFLLYADCDSKCEVNTFNVGQFEYVENQNSNIVLNGGKQDLAELLSKNYEFKYPFAESCKVAYKNSVSNMLHEEVDYENVTNRITDFSTSTINSKDAMELGSAYHRIMQELDYKNEFNIASVIKNLVSNNDIEADIAKKINWSWITCAQSDLIKFVNGQNVTKEAKFMVKLPVERLINSTIKDCVLVQGVIDLIVENENSFDIIDFKTNKRLDKNDYEKLYGLQLKIYALAYEEFSHKKLRGKYIYSFENQSLYQIQ